jgi:hypothetical protein
MTTNEDASRRQQEEEARRRAEEARRERDSATRDAQKGLLGSRDKRERKEGTDNE